jgi:hypothetical protein
MVALYRSSNDWQRIHDTGYTTHYSYVTHTGSTAIQSQNALCVLRSILYRQSMQLFIPGLIKGLMLRYVQKSSLPQRVSAVYGNQHSKNGPSLTPRLSVASVIVLCPRKELRVESRQTYMRISYKSRCDSLFRNDNFQPGPPYHRSIHSVKFKLMYNALQNCLSFQWRYFLKVLRCLPYLKPYTSSADFLCYYRREARTSRDHRPLFTSVCLAARIRFEQIIADTQRLLYMLHDLVRDCM